MKYSALGDTGLRVSQVSYGTAPLGGAFGKVSDLSAAYAAVDVALDAGINLFDSAPYYGDGLAEERLGACLEGRRDRVIISTKAGEYSEGMDFRPERIRRSAHESLSRLRTDYIDILMLHDIEYAELSSLFEDSLAELLSLKREGLCRFIGVTGYPIRTLKRAIAEPHIDVVLNYAHATLLNDELLTDVVPEANRRGIGVMNASSVHLGLLTRTGPKLPRLPEMPEVVAAAAEVRELCLRRGTDVSTLAHQFSIQRSGCATTLIGSIDPKHMAHAIASAEQPIDEGLLAEALRITAPVRRSSWISGLPENN